jgi:uncharacterized membrane protein YkvA (DUF1232 family)
VPFKPTYATASTASTWAQEAYRNVTDVVAMLRAVSADPRVPQAAKVEASAALAYLMTGHRKVGRRIAGFIPVVGRFDDVAVAAFALRRLLNAAGEPVVREHWRGSQRGLDVVLAMTSALATPSGRWRQMAVVGAAAGAVRDQVQNRVPGTRGRRPGFGRVVDGEVLARRDERR